MKTEKKQNMNEKNICIFFFLHISNKKSKMFYETENAFINGKISQIFHSLFIRNKFINYYYQHG